MVATSQNQILSKLKGLTQSLTLPNSKLEASPPSTPSSISTGTTPSSPSTLSTVSTPSLPSTPVTSRFPSAPTSRLPKTPSILSYVNTYLFNNSGKIIRIGLGLLIIFYIGYKFIYPILEFLGYSVETTASQTITSSVHGGQALADSLSKNIKTEENKKKRNKKSAFIKSLDEQTKKKDAEYLPVDDETDSRTQQHKQKHTSGYCYIGDDRGFRSCIEVNESTKCLSGDIFPTRDICINPNLRQ